MGKQHLAIFLVVFFILVALLACVLAGRDGAVLAGVVGGALLRGGAEPDLPRGGAEPDLPRGGAEPDLPRGGAEPDLPRGGAEPGDGSGTTPPPGHHPHDLHPLGIALERYARSLGPEHVVAVHPLDRDRYEALPDREGGAPKAAKTRHWSSFSTWKELRADRKALAKYVEQRSEALNNPNFDWGPVMRELVPRLLENREYIGLVNAEADGRTLRLEAYEASPIEAGTMKSETSFAGVPEELMRKYVERPALFLFHTHPADPRGSPLPSSHDLSSALYLAAHARFAASVVVSRYGALMYTLDWAGYKAVNEAKNWGLALANLAHDVVASHEAIRSWPAHSLADYFAFYPRHRLLVVAWPSPQMVADGRRFNYIWDLETPIDHELIAEHRDDIARLAEKKKKAARSQQARLEPRKTLFPRAERLPEADLGLDLSGVDLGLD